MANPFRVFNNSKMNIYRWSDTEDNFIDGKKYEIIASDVACDLSASTQVIPDSPIPCVVNTYQLFCDKSVDVRVGDRVEIFYRGQEPISYYVGECHMYHYQWQISLKKDVKA